MATYTGFATGTPGGTAASDTSQYVMGLAFSVTRANMQLDGWWWYVAAGQGTAAEDFALWTLSGVAAGTYVTGSKVTSGTFAAGWNFVPCATPIPLVQGTDYLAVKTTNKSGAGSAPYSAIGAYFAAGAGGAGVVNGPLTIWSSSTVQGGTKPDPFNRTQMVFASPATDVTTTLPASSFNNAWYSLDIQVSDVGGVTGTGGIAAPVEVIAGTGAQIFAGTGAIIAPGAGTAYGFGAYGASLYGGSTGLPVSIGGTGAVTPRFPRLGGSVTVRDPGGSVGT